MPGAGALRNSGLGRLLILTPVGWPAAVRARTATTCQKGGHCRPSYPCRAMGTRGDQLILPQLHMRRTQVRRHCHPSYPSRAMGAELRWEDTATHHTSPELWAHQGISWSCPFCACSELRWGGSSRKNYSRTDLFFYRLIRSEILVSQTRIWNRFQIRKKTIAY